MFLYLVRNIALLPRWKIYGRDEDFGPPAPSMLGARFVSHLLNPALGDLFRLFKTNHDNALTSLGHCEDRRWSYGCAWDFCFVRSIHDQSVPMRDEKTSCWLGWWVHGRVVETWFIDCRNLLSWMYCPGVYYGTLLTYDVAPWSLRNSMYAIFTYAGSLRIFMRDWTPLKKWDIDFFRYLRVGERKMGNECVRRRCHALPCSSGMEHCACNHDVVCSCKFIWTRDPKTQSQLMQNNVFFQKRFFEYLKQLWVFGTLGVFFSSST